MPLTAARTTPPSSGTRVRIGVLPSPARAMLHPGHVTVTDADRAWLADAVPPSGRHGRAACLVESVPRWASWCYPTAAPAALGSISRLYTLLFALTDPAVHEWDAYDDFVRMLDGTGDDTGPSVTAYRDAWADLTGAMTAGVRGRHARAHRRWVEALAVESALRAGGHTVHPDVCFPLRRLSAGGESVLLPVEHGLGIDLTPLMRRDRELAGLWRTASTHMVLVNDLFCLRRELLGGQGLHLVPALMHHQGFTLQAAVDVVVRGVADACAEFARTCRTLRARHRDHELRADLDRYLDAVGHMIAGNLAWHYEFRGRPPHPEGSPLVLVLHEDRTELVHE